MSFESIYVLREVMLCRENVLFEVICWCGACLYDGISCYLFGLAGRHFLLDDMICLSVCIVESMNMNYLNINISCRKSKHLFNW